MKDPVLIKSNRYGLTICFDSDLPFANLLTAAAEKFGASAAFFDHAKMAVQFEGRTFTTERFHKKRLEETLAPLSDRDGQFYRGTLRGKQILESEKSIIIIGDIERGAAVISKGSVVVTGSIYGSVTAGAAGDSSAIIAALDMRPKRLRIGYREVKPVIGGSYSWAKLL